MRIRITRHRGLGALCAAAIFSISASAAEEKPAAMKPPADGVSTNQIIFKKPIRRTYGKPLEVVKTDVKINPHPKADAGTPKEGQVAPIANLDAGRSMPGAANYYNELRAAQARQQQASKDKQDSLWMIPRSSLTDLGAAAEATGADKMSAENTKSWGWMAEGMQRIDDINQEKAAAQEKDSDENVIDQVMESMAMDRAAQAEGDKGRTGKKDEARGPRNEFRPYDKSSAKASAADRPWASADRPSRPEEDEEEADAPAPWLVQSPNEKQKDDADSKEQKSQGWASNGNDGWNTPRPAETNATGYQISGGAWTNAGWGGVAPYADARMNGNPNNPWAPSSSPTNSIANPPSFAGMPSSSWTPSTTTGGPAPIQSGFQPIFVQPGMNKGTSVSSPIVDRPVRRNYLDPASSR